MIKSQEESALINDRLKNRFAQFRKLRFTTVTNKESLKKQINTYFLNIKQTLDLTILDVEKIKSKFQLHSDCYPAPMPDNIQQVRNSVVISLLDIQSNTDRAVQDFYEIVKICIECNEDKQGFLSAFQKCLEAVKISEIKWLAEEEKILSDVDSDDYITIFQGVITNLFFSMSSNMKITHNKIADTRSIQSTSTQASLEIILHEQNVKITQPELKLLVVMIQQLTENGAGVLKISLQDLATKLGKKNLKKAREAINLSLNNLKEISLKAIDGKVNFSAPLCKKEVVKIKDSIVYFAFSQDVQDYLLNCRVMPFDNKLLQISSSKTQFPYVSTVGSKILYLANLNRYKDKKKNGEFVISTESLLKICQATGMITYYAASKTSQHINKLIIQPIEKTLDLLVDHKVIKDWFYKNKEGELIKDYIEIKNDNLDSDSYSMAINKKYSEWTSRNVTIEMPDEYLAKIPMYSDKKANNNKKDQKNVNCNYLLTPYCNELLTP